MPYYICAYYADGSRKLGNGDGQAIIRHRRPEQSPLWRDLAIQVRAPSVAYWQLETPDGAMVRRLPNPHFQDNL